jgi:hypothetical protein
VALFCGNEYLEVQVRGDLPRNLRRVARPEQVQSEVFRPDKVAMKHGDLAESESHIHGNHLVVVIRIAITLID